VPRAFTTLTFLAALVLPPGAGPLSAQVSEPAAGQPRPPITVGVSVPADRFIPRDAAIVLELSRPLDPAAERMAVFFGSTDVSALFEAEAAGLRYAAGVLPLPSGESEIVVYHVTGGEWVEIVRQPLKVAGRLGITTAGVDPNLDMGLKSRLGFGRVPAVPAPDRTTYHDLDGKFGLETEVVHVGGRTVVARSAMVGTSHRESSLRFREKGADAPRVDLSSYLVQIQQGGLRLAAGHVAAGNQRHLINSFSSRGTAVSYARGSRVEASVAALHGSNLVGWDDLLGITEPEHRMLNAMVGLEALPRPGALRIELSALDGSVLPRSGFNRAAVTDAEQSRGMAVRVQAAGLNRRLRLDAGFSRSAFDNPADPLLAQGADLVEVQRETRNARYLESSLDVLRALRLTGRRTARLTIGLAHERVDPLFRTVATYARADQLQNRVELRGDVAGVSLGANHSRGENNLDEVPSVLKTLTRRTGVDVRLPAATVLGVRPSGWWPNLGYRLDRTHQFGAAVPGAGGFEPSHVPDQVSDNQTATAEWRWRRASIAYQFNRSLQDNRQPGREQADLKTQSNGVNLTLSPVRSLSLTGSLSQADAHNVERDETDRTRRYSGGVNWTPLRGSTLALQLSETRRDNGGSVRADRSLSSQWSSPVPGLDRFGGKWHLRFARSANETRNATLDLDQRRSDWSLDSGLSFRFF
jgi:hypothetical protein